MGAHNFQMSILEIPNTIGGPPFPLQLNQRGYMPNTGYPVQQTAQQRSGDKLQAGSFPTTTTTTTTIVPAISATICRLPSG